ncbi:chemotaxis protein CheW [Aminivibrio sp.]|jgi:purine-binding chemotaxis protein CheW|uniref:chemotaxis protein CheW n=1 Tax=Aminivibrio sp. TaxID=1872489 RepID=UPI001A4177F1|nr:chemotaxis protein CheW [Aminivibrio sp.]MBL3540016.1 chemotaxis protein CheW [Aminivibrio sp.]
MAEQQLVVFRLGKEEFGIDISRVREIVRLQNITAIPRTMDFVEGIVNLRGRIVPIVDLCKRFRVANSSSVEESARRIIVVNMAEQNIGVLVDGVSEILRIPDESIEPTPPIVAGDVSADFIRGIAKVENRLIIVLDLDRIFSVEEKAVLAQAVE